MRFFLLLFYHVIFVEACGNYCGAYYCGGQLDVYGTCDRSPKPRDLIGTCLDACCQAHDECCYDKGNRSHCNSNVLACLDTCEFTDTTCLYGVLPVIKPLVSLAMGVVEDWCCNAPC